MSCYSTVFFDLDGTLTDPGEGITRSVDYALQRFDIRVSSLTELYPFIGPPLLDSFEKMFGFSHEQARLAVQYYREYYREKGIFQNLVYPGIEQLLQDLSDNGVTLVLATAKPEPFAKEILQHFDLLKYFSLVVGSTLDETRTRKDQVLRYALQQSPPDTAAHAIMVGDRKHDVHGAAAVGIPCIGVLFGYGSRDELQNAGAFALAQNVSQLRTLLIPE